MDLNKDIKDIHLNINSSTFNILYRKYKSFVLPSGIILACLFAFLLIVMPQVNSVLSARDQEKLETIKLQKLQNNLNVLNNLDQVELNTNLDSLSRALPSTKDFAGIISSISDKSVQAGVLLGDFSFNVGDLSTINAGVGSFPSLQINLSVTGSPDSIFSFIKLLYKSLPLVEISTVSSDGNSASLLVKFYYKSYPQGTISDETIVLPFSPKDIELIDKVTSWKTDIASSIPIVSTSESIDSPKIPTATDSAETNVASESSEINPL